MSAIQPGDLVLVTGANGYIGSAICRCLLDRGFSVRGTVRSASKQNWLLSHFGPNFSLVEVPDMNADGALSEAIKGVRGVVHVAADMSMGVSASIVTDTIKGVVGLLETAAKESSVRRVVLTSSAAACVWSQPGTPYKITQDTYNDDAIRAFEHLSDADEDSRDTSVPRAGMVYAAAKALGDKTGFEWVREHKPAFTLNCVVPNLNLGAVESVENMGLPSSAGLIDGLAYGNNLGVAMMRSQYFVNVEDTALLHVAALTLEDIKQERILAFAESFSWTTVLGILHKHYPSRVFAVVDEPAVDMGEVDNSLSIKLLQRLGRKGFKNLEETVIENMEASIAGESFPTKPKSRFDLMLEAMTASSVDRTAAAPLGQH